MKTCTDLLYIFVMNWDNLTSTTSAVATLSSSQESVNCTNSLTLKQLITAMSVNWHLKWCLSDSLKFREKRVKFRSWLQQIVAKWNVNMSNNNVSVQFWYLHSQLKELTLSQVTPWIAVCIKSNEALNYTIIEELINQLQHVYNNSELRERATCILKALKQKEKSFVKHLIIFEQTLWKTRGLK